MSRIVAIAVVTTLTFMPIGKSSLSSATVPPASRLEVMVLFSGLMVFNLNPDTGSYEVGILSEKDAHKHLFCIHQQGISTLCRKELPQGKKWTLRVSDPPGGTHVAVGHGNKRRPDHKKGQYDFDWIIDLDGPEFHKDGLKLLEGHLDPIIQLPKAKMFTMYKSPDFVRWQGSEPANPPDFGFVAETVGFRVQLEPREEMVLEAGEGNEKKEIFRISHASPAPIGGNYRLVTISNTRYPPYKDSDFFHYYQLFTNPDGSAIDYTEQYNFGPKKTEPYQAFNPLPTYNFEGYRTCCGLVCTQIRLVQWEKALH